MNQEDLQISSFSNHFPTKRSFTIDNNNEFDDGSSCNLQRESFKSQELINTDFLYQISNNSKRKFFTQNEDDLLINAVLKNKKESWNDIAKKVPGRTPKQCRDRWVNYLQPTLNFEPFSLAEDQLLVSLVNKYGTHWAKMKSYFPSRSTSSIKDRWYSLIKDQVKALPIEKIIYSFLDIFSKNQITIQSSSNNEFLNIVNQNDIFTMNQDNINSNLIHLSSEAQGKNDNQKYYYLVKANHDTLKQNNENQNSRSIFESNNQFKNDELITFTPEELEW